MSEFNRGIMKFDDADRPLTVAVWGLLIIGGIVFLLWWGLHYAYI
ncbi:MAG: hypothetical protein ACK4QL_05255 [Pseudanabaenaceae cyanobacterium]